MDIVCPSDKWCQGNKDDSLILKVNQDDESIKNEEKEYIFWLRYQPQRKILNRDYMKLLHNSQLIMQSKWGQWRMKKQQQQPVRVEKE